MAHGKYIYNAQTQAYEIHRLSFGRWMKNLWIYLCIGAVLLGGYVILNRMFFHNQTPKEILLAERNRRLLHRVDYINEKLDRQSQSLAELAMRDNLIYRPIFGMDQIPADIRGAGYDDPDRYEYFNNFKNSSFLKNAVHTQDVTMRKAYLQTLSFDDVEKVAAHAGDMANCVPSLYPVCPGGKIQISSPFGYRVHPLAHSVVFHRGTDISGPKGTPVYASADGVVSLEYKHAGYGNMVIIDHGFGYQSRYAHLYTTCVAPGQKVRRGDQIATMGSTGRSTGTHLHYEVLYKGKNVNPWNYFDKDIDAKTYMTLVKPADKTK
ncbi:MAG: M23 family metallopeptidase [Bacteroidales bacterium]|nr:M23 family metallopeptidase [Bacteroidales bacterium]